MFHLGTCRRGPGDRPGGGTWVEAGGRTWGEARGEAGGGTGGEAGGGTGGGTGGEAGGGRYKENKRRCKAGEEKDRGERRRTGGWEEGRNASPLTL